MAIRSPHLASARIGAVCRIDVGGRNIKSWRGAASFLVKAGSGIAVSTLALWAVVRDVPLGEVLASLSSVRPGMLLLAPLAICATFAARVERWRWLLRIDDPRSRRPLLWAILLGYFGGAILPFKLGEGLRMYVARRLADVPFPRSLSTIAVEHVFDVGTLLAFLLLAWPTLPNSPVISGLRWAGALVFMSLAIVFWILVFSHQRVLSLLAHLKSRLPRALRQIRLWRWLDDFFISFSQLRSRRVLGIVLLWSCIAWALSGLFHTLVLLAFDIRGVLLQGTVLTLVITNSPILLPLAPGNIGVYEYLSVVVLGALQVPPALALAYALASHALLLSIFVVAGSISMLFSGVGWSIVGTGWRHQEERLENTPHVP